VRVVSTTVYVPRETTACSLGADAVAAAIAQQALANRQTMRIVRSGSRGAFWLEPLVEVELAGQRIAYGPVRAPQVAELFAADFLHGGAHRLKLGTVADLPWLRQQQRLTAARLGVIDPLSLDDYRRHGGLAGLQAALVLPAAGIVQAVIDSGLRGRGGAAFPTGIKWQTVLAAGGAQKYIVCNADEGDSGTYSDRLLMEGDPFMLIEGMIIAALAVGATRGYIYLRSEYPAARRVLAEALASARAAGLLGPDILGSRRAFELELRIGAGAYICGEETALLESLEGRRGQVRYRPPLPAVKGLFNCPTVVNNVVTLASVPLILQQGAKFYRDYGQGRSRGTVLLQLAGNIARGGLVEKAFGVTLRELLYDFGGGTRSGRPIRAVQIGGPLGAYWPAEKFDTPLDYEAVAAAGGMLGHGGVVVFDDTVNLAEQARFAMEFCAFESCGKCTPCRIGSTRGVEVIDRLRAGDRPELQQTLLRDLCQTMTDASLCALGGLTASPVLSALDHFPSDFGLQAARSAAGSSRP
jgi:formate dehydrogenase iron-sulfur subunit